MAANPFEGLAAVDKGATIVHDKEVAADRSSDVGGRLLHEWTSASAAKGPHHQNQGLSKLLRSAGAEVALLERDNSLLRRHLEALQKSKIDLQAQLQQSQALVRSKEQENASLTSKMHKIRTSYLRLGSQREVLRDRTAKRLQMQEEKQKKQRELDQQKMALDQAKFEEVLAVGRITSMINAVGSVALSAGIDKEETIRQIAQVTKKFRIMGTENDSRVRNIARTIRNTCEHLVRLSSCDCEEAGAGASDQTIRETVSNDVYDQEMQFQID